jgi:hypothetical protein
MCGTDVEVEQQVFKSFESPNPAEIIQQLVEAGKLLQADKPGANVTQYKSICSVDLPAVPPSTDQVVPPSAGR